jgi:hypothetical protein
MAHQTDDIKTTFADFLEQYLYEVWVGWHRLPSDAVNPIQAAITKASTGLTYPLRNLDEVATALRKMIIEIGEAFGKTLSENKAEDLLEAYCYHYSLNLNLLQQISVTLENPAEYTFGKQLIQGWIEILVHWIGTLVMDDFCKCIEAEKSEASTYTYEYSPSETIPSDEPSDANDIDDAAKSTDGTDEDINKMPEEFEQLYFAMYRQRTTWLHLPGWRVLPVRESINRASATVEQIHGLEPLKTSEGHQVLINMIMEIGKYLDCPLSEDDAEKWLKRHWDYYNDYERVKEGSFRFDRRWWRSFVRRFGSLAATELNREAQAAEAAREAALEAEPEEPTTPGSLRELLPGLKKANIRRLEAIFADAQASGSLSHSGRLRLGEIMVQERGSLAAYERGPGGDCFLLVSGKRLLLLNGFNCWTILEDECFSTGTLQLGKPQWELQDHMVRISLMDFKEGQPRILLCWFGSSDGPLVAKANQAY